MDERTLELMPRDEGTRDCFHTDVLRFDLDQILQHFTETIDAIKAQFSVADGLIGEGKSAEGENIWRAQILFLVSAFDFYMHELTKYGLCEIYEGDWERTEKYENIQIRMKAIEQALRSGEGIDWFLDYINGFYGTVTMVSFASVKDQLNLLGIEMTKVAEHAFYQVCSTEKPKDKLKRRLNGLSKRRNIIAHQTDRAHTDAQILSISKEIVQDFIADIEMIVDGIDVKAREKCRCVHPPSCGTA